MRKFAIIMTIIIVCISLFGCNNVSGSIKWSESKHSDTTGKNYEELQGYKAAFYSVEEITVDPIKQWLESCDTTTNHYQYANSDADSWEMYLYFPSDESTNYDKLKFYLDESGLNIHVQTNQATEKNQDYLLILIQASPRGPWPTAAKLFIDDIEILFDKTAN